MITGSFNDWKLSPFTSLSFGPSLKYYSLWIQVDKAKLYTFKHAICVILQKCSCMVDIRFLCVQVWCQRLGKKFNKLAMFSHFRGKFKFYVNLSYCNVPFSTWMNGLWPMVPPDTCTSQSLDKSVPFFTNIYKKNWAWLVATLNAYVKHWQQFYILDKGSANTMQSSKKISKVHVVNFLTYIRVYICYKQDR